MLEHMNIVAIQVLEIIKNCICSVIISFYAHIGKCSDISYQLDTLVATEVATLLDTLVSNHFKYFLKFL